LNFVFSDLGETHVLQLENAVLHHWERDVDPDAAATVTLTRGMFLKMGTGQVGLRDFIGRVRRGWQPHRAALLLPPARRAESRLPDRHAMTGAGLR
jgi:alkyl sulfatase BDS1-like metallo-beta-lactamase superfamily hydrolase